MVQLKDVVEIAEYKYKASDGWNDQSSCHRAMAKDALDASRMNVKPGGKQPKMRDTIWAGQVQTMCSEDGTPKGIKQAGFRRGW